MSSFRNADKNPCLEEINASAKCMDVNSYKREMCVPYFTKYEHCKKFWKVLLDTRYSIVTDYFAENCLLDGSSEQHQIKMNRRRAGVKPVMPTAEERKQILASLEFMPY